MACVLAAMVAGLLGFTTNLHAMAPLDSGVLALAFTMTRLLACVGAAFQFLAARETAVHPFDPARLIFEYRLGTDAAFLDKKGAFRA